MMKPLSRMILVAVVLALGLVGQLALRAHVQSAGALPVGQLSQPLTALPLELGPWRGQDQPIENNDLLYADEHQQRVYYHTNRQQALTLWIVYSGQGADRGHHPEVCMAVAGKPEDPAARKTLDLPGREAPVQQYRFGRPGDYQWVYYWHYTLPVPAHDQLSGIQKFYRSLRQRPASVTVEVFAPETSPDDPQYLGEFVQLVDAAMQPLVGSDAVLGSHRQPVTLVAPQP